MEEPPKPTRPYRLVRAVLSAWLLVWGAMILVLVWTQFSSQPLFNWKMSLAWIGISVLGWLLVYRVLQRLRKLPPE